MVLQIKRDFRPCVVDQKCLAKNIIYFSFLIPLHHQIVYDFVIGCATGQSCFVAIEKRSKCLVWASIPYDTVLSSYCLFEIIIDRSKGGTFTGCQNILDQLFRSVQITTKYTLNRLPYVIEKCPPKKRRSGFISTLKKLFNVSSFCNIVTEDIEKLKLEESDKLKNAIFVNDGKMPKWAERMFNTKNVRERCAKKDPLSEYTIEMKAVDLTYAQKTTVQNELKNYQTYYAVENTVKNIFTPTLDDDAQLVLIDIDMGPDQFVGSRHSIKSWRKASLLSVGQTNTPNAFDALIITDGPKDPINNKAIFTDDVKSRSFTILKEEAAELAFLSPTTNINQEINRNDSDDEVESIADQGAPGLASQLPPMDPMNMSHYTPTVTIHPDEKQEKSEFEQTKSTSISNQPKKNLTAMIDDDNIEIPDLTSVRLSGIDTKLRESDLVVKLSSRAMMDIASNLHQCGLIKGERVTPKLDYHVFSKFTAQRTSIDTKLYSVHDGDFANAVTNSVTNKETSLSQFSNLCSSTSNTERFMSPQLVTSMEHIEMRDQLWTPVPISEHDLLSNTNNTFNCQDYQMECRMSDWKRRLRQTMEKYMAEQLF